mgnify:CR=1 FL=1|jgi:hypothetical protein
MREDLGAIASPSPSDLRAEQHSSRCCAGSAEQAPRKHPPRGLASRSAAPYAARKQYDHVEPTRAPSGRHLREQCRVQ